jgi:hypothetical protein
VQLRHAAELPQGVLQSFTEALEALGEANGAGLPVRVSQHEVVDQVSERSTVDRYAQVGAVGEVAGSQPAGMMHLGEEDLLGGAFLGSPLLDPPLQGPQLTIGEAAGEAPLQVGQESLRLQSGVDLEQRLQFGPDLDEGVRVSPPVPVHGFDLAGEQARPTVLACGLGIHAGSCCRHLFGNPIPIQATELPHLLIGDHREPPCQGALDDDHPRPDREF